MRASISQPGIGPSTTALAGTPVASSKARSSEAASKVTMPTRARPTAASMNGRRQAGSAFRTILRGETSGAVTKHAGMPART